MSLFTKPLPNNEGDTIYASHLNTLSNNVATAFEEQADKDANQDSVIATTTADRQAAEDAAAAALVSENLAKDYADGSGNDGEPTNGSAMTNRDEAEVFKDEAEAARDIAIGYRANVNIFLNPEFIGNQVGYPTNFNLGIGLAGSIVADCWTLNSVGAGATQTNSANFLAKSVTLPTSHLLQSGKHIFFACQQALLTASCLYGGFTLVHGGGTVDVTAGNPVTFAPQPLTAYNASLGVKRHPTEAIVVGMKLEEGSISTGFTTDITPQGSYSNTKRYMRVWKDGDVIGPVYVDSGTAYIVIEDCPFDNQYELLCCSAPDTMTDDAGTIELVGITGVSHTSTTVSNITDLSYNIPTTDSNSHTLTLPGTGAPDMSGMAKVGAGHYLMINTKHITR